MASKLSQKRGLPARGQTSFVNLQLIKKSRIFVKILKMNRYALKNSIGETISYTTANSLIQAQEYFAEVKKIGLNQLLEIFIVVEVE